MLAGFLVNDGCAAVLDSVNETESHYSEQKIDRGNLCLFDDLDDRASMELTIGGF
jgi:hypothetical protein